MRMTIAILKAAADETRVRILLALSRHELCVCQLTELMGLAPSTVSKHLSVLHGAGLVTMRKSGKWVYCRLAGRGARREVREILKWVIACAGGTEAARRDSARLKNIAASPPEAACEKTGR